MAHGVDSIDDKLHLPLLLIGRVLANPLTICNKKRHNAGFYDMFLVEVVVLARVLYFIVLTAGFQFPQHFNIIPLPGWPLEGFAVSLASQQPAFI